MMFKGEAREKLIKKSAVTEKKLWLMFILILSNFAAVDVLLATPRKVGSAEWKTGWNHQNAVTTRSSDRKTLVTNLPEVDNINGPLTSYFRLTMGNGSNTVITIRPLQYQNWVKCPTVTVNGPFVESWCEVKHHTPGDNGLRHLTQRTKVKFEIKSPGHTARYLYWELVPAEAPPLTGSPPQSPGQPQSQIYEIGPSETAAFFAAAMERGYLFLISKKYPLVLDDVLPDPFPPVGNNNLNPGFVLKDGGVFIKFGNVTYAPVPFSNETPMVIRMFDEKQTLNPGWTFEKVNYRAQGGEACRKRNFKKHEGTDKIFHQFEVGAQLVSFPPVKSCSKLWLQSIRLKGPVGRRAEEALRE